MNADERRHLLDEVRLASSCSHPIRLNGEMVDVATGEVSSRSLRVACKDRRRVVCPACSSLYKADAWILVAAGLAGGKGIDADVTSHPKMFVTLTAPGFGPVHTVAKNGSCQVISKGVGTTCPHGVATSCPIRHEADDPRLGTPICEHCFDYVGAVRWNAHASRLFSATIRQVQRRLAAEGGLPQVALASVARLNYLKVAEMQRRGLVHFHCVLRLDGPDHSASSAPDWLDIGLLSETLVKTIRTIELVGVDGRGVRWGNKFHLSDLNPAKDDALKIANYVAKYAVKTTDGTIDLAYRFSSRRQIENLNIDEHRKMLALAAWDLNADPALEDLHSKLHAHAFGFTGQLITKSRGFTTTFGALRHARAEFMAPSNQFEVLQGTFHYEGRGYDHPRGVELAEVFFSMDAELRKERAEARREGD